MSDCIKEVIVQTSVPNQITVSVNPPQGTIGSVTQPPSMVAVVQTGGIQGIQGLKGDPGDPGQDGQDVQVPVNPVFSYTSGKLTRIDYDDGAFKKFTYNGSGVLTQLDFFFNGGTKRKTFIYTSGILTSIDEVTI